MVVIRLLKNIGMAVRMLRPQPGLNATSILTLGLGNGLTITVFSIVNTTLIEGLPFEDPHELVVVRTRNPGCAI